MSNNYQKMGHEIDWLIDRLNHADKTSIGEINGYLDSLMTTALIIRRYYEMIDGVEWKS